MLGPGGGAMLHAGHPACGVAQGQWFPPGRVKPESGVRRLWGAKGGIQAAVFPDPTASNIATPASWPRAGIMRQSGAALSVNLT